MVRQKLFFLLVAVALMVFAGCNQPKYDAEAVFADGYYCGYLDGYEARVAEENINEYGADNDDISFWSGLEWNSE